MNQLTINDREFFEPQPELLPTPDPFIKFLNRKEQKLCSFFSKPVSNTRPTKQMSVLEIYNLIKSDYYKSYTKVLRAISDPVIARNYKARAFDYVTFSGLFYKRSEAGLLQHSGLLTLDFDHVPYPEKLKEKLINDTSFETAISFVSPSGDGLKWVISIQIPEYTHLQWFTGVSNYIKKIYSLEVDKSGKDVSRCCFLPWDENAYINPKFL